MHLHSCFFQQRGAVLFEFLDGQGFFLCWRFHFDVWGLAGLRGSLLFIYSLLYSSQEAESGQTVPGVVQEFLVVAVIFR